MKKLIFVFAFTLFIAGRSQAQQSGKTKHMTVTIIDAHISFSIGSKGYNMLITRDDTAQVQKWVDLSVHAKLRDQPGAYESMLMKLIQPFYDQGWKLVSTSAEAVGPNPPTETFRYYFVKE